MISFATYLDSLIGSWRALAAVHAEAKVVAGDGYVTARFPTVPILDNALLFDAARLPEVQAVYADVERYAVWTADTPTANRVAEAGFARDEMTVAMVCPLPLLDDPPRDLVPAARGVGRTEVDTIAGLNQVPVTMLRGVPGARAYATTEADSGALLIEVSTDVNVSFVATRPDRRRRGLATAVLRHALTEAADDGFVSASLQATAMATQLYRDIGFRQVGLWQEWVPPSDVGGR